MIFSVPVTFFAAYHYIPIFNSWVDAHYILQERLLEVLCNNARSYFDRYPIQR